MPQKLSVGFPVKIILAVIEQDTPEFGMWDDEAIKAYAELIEEHPEFSSMLDDHDNKEASKALFRQKGQKSFVLEEDAQEFANQMHLDG